MGITLYGWGATFDAPSASPFVAKADIQMQMLGLDFERAIADLQSVPKHKAPYVRDDGELIEDSTFIRWHFEKKLGKDLDAGLTPEQRAMSWTLERMLEHRLVPIMACERWLVDANFEKGPRMFFQRVPEAMREQVIQKVRGDLTTTMHGAGFTRFSRDERMQLGAKDIEVCATLLGDKTYVFGDRSTAADAILYGALAASGTRFFESKMPDIIDGHANLVAYLKRMEKEFFPVDRWPKMM